MAIEIRSSLLAALLCTSIAANAAEPNRQALIDAWSEYMPTTPGTLEFEPRGDETYFIKDENLPYEGELRIIGAVVRPIEIGAGGASFTHLGLIEFELVGLAEDLRESQSYYYWLADRQSLYFSEADRAWLGSAAYSAAFQDYYVNETSFELLSFMLNYGIWILLIVLVVWVFAALRKHSREARALMDDSASINDQARENLDRSEKMQKEIIEISRRTLELQESNNRLLEDIRDSLKR